ncbi:MAG TPA: DUF1573 domain-containing protein [Fimbriiglobus sp.]|nr:DUF1573 domain-containing protein [Fimbriiglobus sp.]
MALLRILRRCWWVFPPTLALFIGYWWRTGAIEQSWVAATGGPPIIEYPAVIDLGDRRANEIVASRFEIANRGGQELIVEQVKASCSCGSLQHEVGDHSEAIQELRLAPGERANVVVHTTVQVDGAGTFHQTVSFLTNDPDHPEGRITIVFRTASGGLRVNPGAVQFGRVSVGREVHQFLDVTDRDQPPQTVTRVVSADPDRVAVHWVPVGPNPENSGAGVRLGRIEVIPNTARPSLLDTPISVEFADPNIQPVTIQVRGRVAPRVEVIPPSLTLPLSAGTGPVYTGKCLVRGPDAGPLKLEVESASPDLTVELPGPPDGVTRTVQITWVPDTGEGRGVSRKTVRLRATTGEESETIEIPVTCEHP